MLDVRVDPNMPPTPPHATVRQMKDMAQAMLTGDEDRRGVAVEGLKAKIQEFLPHGKDRVVETLTAANGRS